MKNLLQKKLIDWYGSSELLSGFGRMILGESYALTGNKEKGPTANKRRLDNRGAH